MCDVRYSSCCTSKHVPPVTCCLQAITEQKAEQPWLGIYLPELVGRVCQTGASGEVCATAGRVTPSLLAQMAGRVTPSLLAQMAGAANVSYVLSMYGPVLADCTFVPRAFQAVGDDHCRRAPPQAPLPRVRPLHRRR